MAGSETKVHLNELTVQKREREDNPERRKNRNKQGRRSEHRRHMDQNKELKKEGRDITSLNLAFGPDSCIEVNGRMGHAWRNTLNPNVSTLYDF